VSAQVEPRLKADPEPCPCGCGVVGRPTKGTGHPRNCACPRCRGGRNRRKGMTAQRQFQKAAGIKQARFRGINGNEEGWRDYWAWEIKSGSQVRPVITAYRKCRAQVEANRALGDNRPVAIGASYDGEEVVIVRAEEWATHVAPMLEAP
jgi:hypothetical protein